ncbi:MAG: PH domain-containing protein, partial [Clostridia bacterium]|nr:PH domain-containing protein [Clostridia bacterium]
SLTRSFIQRIFGVGTVCVQSSDKTCPHLDIINVRDPRAVKEIIFQNVEAAKEKRRMRATEILDDDDGEFLGDDDMSNDDCAAEA